MTSWYARYTHGSQVEPPSDCEWVVSELLVSCWRWKMMERTIWISTFGWLQFFTTPQIWKKFASNAIHAVLGRPHSTPRFGCEWQDVLRGTLRRRCLADMSDMHTMASMPQGRRAFAEVWSWLIGQSLLAKTWSDIFPGTDGIQLDNAEIFHWC